IGRRNTELNEANIKLNKENSDNNLLLAQFSKASELLMNDNITARLSGIYLFEKIMNNSEEYHWTVIEILTAFIREKRSKDKYIVNEENGYFDERNGFVYNSEALNESYIKTITIKTDLNKTDANLITFRAIPIEKDVQA